MSMALASDLLVVADELTEPHQHTELIAGEWTRSRNRAKPRRHTIVLPGLLQQLHDAALDPSTGLLEGGSSGKPASRAPLAVEALSAYQDVCAGALRWVRSVRIDPRPAVESNIRALVGLVPRLDLDTLEALYAEMRQWKRWAALMTGWDTPPFRPRINCPSCESRSSIWINVDRMLAVCKECQAYWEDGQIGDLADLTRAAAA